MAAPNQAMGTAASAGSAGMIAVLVVWGLSELNISIPTEAAIALSTLLAPTIHQVCNLVNAWLASREAIYGRREGDAPAPGTFTKPSEIGEKNAGGT